MKDESDVQPMIIGVSETWIASNEEAKLGIYRIKGYDFISSHRATGKQGGVGQYILHGVDYEKRTDITINEAESIWIEIKVKNHKSIVVGTIYSTPVQRNQGSFLNSLDMAMEKLNIERKSVVLMGDFNINLFSGPGAQEYARIAIANGYKSTTAFPTRVEVNKRTGGITESLIDHVLLNVTTRDPLLAGVLDLDISDHAMNFLSLPLQNNATKNEIPDNTVLSFKNYTAEKAVSNVQRINWDDVHDTEDPSLAFDRFVTKLRKAQAEVIPTKPLSRNTQFKQPWLTNDLRQAQKQRQKLYKKCKKQPLSKELQERYKRLRNWVCNEIRKAEKRYYLNLVDQAGGNQGKTWQVINEIMGRKRHSAGLPEKIHQNDGKEVTGRQQICDAMNSFFVNIGPELAKKVKSIDANPIAQIKQVSPEESFFIKPVTEYEIFCKLSRLNPRKAFGPDGLHPRFLKDIAPWITSPLTSIINRSFEKGIVPMQMKIARVVPIYKSGDKKRTNNYRPISILSVFAKIIEGFIHDGLLAFLKKKNILSADQYGFQKGKSTKGAVIRFVDEIQRNVDEGKAAGAVYIDLTKAFDTVDHCILLKKLEHYGIRGIPSKWFESYFNERNQYIQQGKVQSRTLKIRCGVPQGSNLGPLLFLIYVNDLGDCLRFSRAILFADDTTLYLSNHDGQTLTSRLNEDLTNLATWFQLNKLTLNVGKTYSCEFRNQRPERLGNLYINNQLIERSNSVRYLGVHLDGQLTWKSHVAQLANKLSQTAGVMNKIRGYLTLEAMRKIYYALIHSRIAYCLEIWGTAYSTVLQPIVVAQKKAVRAVAKASFRAHTEPLFSQLQIKTLHQEIKYRRALTAYDIVQNPIQYGVQLHDPTTEQHRYNTRFATSNFPIPKKRTTRHGLEGIQCLYLKAYNQLPRLIKNSRLPTIRVKRRIEQSIL